MADNDESLPAEVAAQREQGLPVWDTEGLQVAFKVLGFYAPYVVVEQRSTGRIGTLTFTHRPRWYYDWTETDTTS